MKIKKVIILIVIFITIIYGAFEIYIGKYVSKVYEEEAKKIISSILNDSINESFDDGIKYKDLVEIVQDEKGNVVLIKNDTLKMNELSFAANKAAQEKIDEEGKNGIDVPIGYLFGSHLFSETLPKINFKFRQNGNVNSIFESEFQSAGINQTKHTIFLKLEAEIIILLPGQTKTVKLSSSVPVCETIIVGNVPEGYLNLK